ncbi:MAG: peptidoglycan DD-metalloendopeptidase family protein [Actinobacteria bacterium]|nr:peptidoglycan DD-metalloendopeptidase family protein [Actinomycetota bacterium]
MLAAAAAACLLIQAPAVASPTGDLRQRRQQSERRLDAARSDLAETKRQRADTRSTLQEIDGQQTRLAAELAALTQQLEAAEERLREAQHALRRTKAEISTTTAQLQATERDLRAREKLLRARARASYMHGGINYAEAVLDVRTANELGVSLQYMRTMITEDRDQVERISSLETTYETMLERLDELGAAQDEARAKRAAERDRVAGLVARKREVEAQLAAQEQQHTALLAELDTDAQRYRAAIDDLEAESQKLRQRLAAVASQDGAANRTATQRSSSGFQWPVNGAITSSFGYRTHPVLGYRRLHAGTDFGAATGTPIVAADGGVVVSAGWLGGYGNAVVISHGGGIATLYAHQSRLAVGAGSSVSRGQVIGYVGSTGMSTGPHLHFEVRVNGGPVDAARYL